MSEETSGMHDERLRAALRGPLRSSDDLAFAYLFGSAVKGAQRPDSDVDVAIHLMNGDVADRSERPGLVDALSAERRVEIAERSRELEAVLQSELDRPVQVVALELAPHDLVHNVLRHGRLLVCRDEELRARFFVAHARRHFDLLGARRIFDRYRRRRIQEGSFGGRGRDGS